MRGYRLCTFRLARGRLQASVATGLALGACSVGLLPAAPAQAASRSTSGLRRAFSQTLIAVRVTGNAAVCSSATREGRIALTEILRGEYEYLPSTTCTEAFAGRAAAEEEAFHACGLNPTISAFVTSTSHAPAFEPVINTAVIRVKGDRATIGLTHDDICNSEEQVTGASAVLVDPLGTSHWLRKHGRWLFDDQPTGTYSPAGRKAVAMLRGALSGRSITEEGLPGLTLTVPFCTNGTTQPVVSIKGESSVEAPGFWYVAAGLSTSGQHGPPFDAQGDPQGYVSAPNSISDEWDVKLVGGALTVTQPPDRTIPVGAPGSAGC